MRSSVMFSGTTKRACVCLNKRAFNAGGGFHESRDSQMRSATLSSSVGILPNEKSRTLRKSVPTWLRLLFVADHEMDHAGGIGNPEAVEIFPELFHFIATRDTVDLQVGRGRFGVVRFQLEPDIGMAQVRDPVEPEPIRAELENAAFRFLLDQ